MHTTHTNEELRDAIVASDPLLKPHAATVLEVLNLADWQGLNSDEHEQVSPRVDNRCRPGDRETVIVDEIVVLDRQFVVAHAVAEWFGFTLHADEELSGLYQVRKWVGTWDRLGSGEVACMGDGEGGGKWAIWSAMQRRALEVAK